MGGGGGGGGAWGRWKCNHNNDWMSALGTQLGPQRINQCSAFVLDQVG